MIALRVVPRVPVVKLSDGSDWLDPTTVLDESNPTTFRTYTLAKSISEVLLYFLENEPDAFGNAEYARKEGFLHGYLSGIEASLCEGDDVWRVMKGNRVLLEVEVPAKPQSYWESIRENRRLLGIF